MSDPARARAVEFGFEELRFGVQNALEAAAGAEGRGGDAARAALERVGPDLPALLGSSREALDGAGLSSQARELVADAAPAVVRVTPPGPWQARFLRAAAQCELLAPAEVERHAVAWLKGLPREAGNGAWQSADWLEPLREVVGSARHPRAAWALLDVAARRGVVDPWAGALLQELWAGAPGSAEPGAFVAGAVRWRRPDVLYPALQTVFRSRGPHRAGDQWDVVTAALVDVLPGPGHDFGQRLAGCFTEVLRDPDVQKTADLPQRVFNLLLWVERVNDLLLTAPALALIDQLYGFRTSLPPAKRKEFFIRAYNVLLHHGRGRAFTKGAEAALTLCDNATEIRVGGEEHRWDLDELWSWLARNPSLRDLRHKSLGLALRLGDRATFRKVLAALVAEPTLSNEVKNVVEGYARHAPDQSLEDIFKMLADLPGERLRGAAKDNALALLEWVRFVTPPPPPPAAPVEPAPQAAAEVAPPPAAMTPPVISGEGTPVADPARAPDAPPPPPLAPAAAPTDGAGQGPEWVAPPPSHVPSSVPVAGGKGSTSVEEPVAVRGAAAGAVDEPATDSLIGDTVAPPTAEAGPGGGVGTAPSRPRFWRRRRTGVAVAVVVLAAGGGWLAWTRPWAKADAAGGTEPKTTDTVPTGTNTAPRKTQGDQSTGLPSTARPVAAEKTGPTGHGPRGYNPT